MKVKKSSLAPILQIIFGALILIGASRVYLKTYHQALQVSQQAEAAKAVSKETEDKVQPQENKDQSLDSEQVQATEKAPVSDQISESKPAVVETAPVVEYYAPVEYVEEVIVADSPVVVEPVPSVEPPAEAPATEEVVVEKEAAPAEE